MDDIYSGLLELMDRGEPAALATVVATRGSVPREPGTRMLICPGGRNLGTVGGGCGEADVMRQALDVIAGGRPRLVQVDLNEGISMASRGICGGTMDVFVETWPRQDRALLQALVAAHTSGEPVAVLTIVAAPEPALLGRRLLVGGHDTAGSLGLGEAEAELVGRAREAAMEGTSRLLASGLVKAFLHIPERKPVALIVGAGHIAVPLAQMADLCDFRVVILDDRPGFANRERFPMAETVILGDYQEELRRFPIDRGTYVILITRGHEQDVPCLLELLDRPAGYIGMIGSKRRVAGVFQLLQSEHGIAAETLSRVHSPIGLDIGAETPAEIAVSIMAEIIQARRRPRG